MKRLSIIMLTIASCMAMNGCSKGGNSTPPLPVGIRMSVTPMLVYFYETEGEATITIDVDEDVTWTCSRPDEAEWLRIECEESRAVLRADAIEEDEAGDRPSRSTTVSVTASRGIYHRTIPVEVYQYNDEEVPSDAPIRFVDRVFNAFVVAEYDENDDNTVSPIEAATVKTMDCSDMNIESLSGIEYFINLTSLDCRNNALTTLDVCKNRQLKRLDCTGNNIKTLWLANGQTIAELLTDEGVNILYR